jgi:hypothetical protein
MENTEVENELPEKTQSIDNTTEKKKNLDHVPSQRQIDHLKYAREMKRLKQQTREQEVEAQNKNLDFIYRRLTSIDRVLATLAESDLPKRKTSVTKKRKASDESDSESAKKTQKKKEETTNADYYRGIANYFGKVCFVGGTAFLFSFIKQYANANITTTDGDSINGYLFAKDF